MFPARRVALRLNRHHLNQLRILESYPVLYNTSTPPYTKRFLQYRTKDVYYNNCPYPLNKLCLFEGSRSQHRRPKKSSMYDQALLLSTVSYYSAGANNARSTSKHGSCVVSSSLMLKHLNYSVQSHRPNTNAHKPPDKSLSNPTVLSSTDLKEDSESEEQALHLDRNFITALRAMKEFLLKPEDLVGLRVTSRRSAKDGYIDLPIHVYWRKDVEARSLEVWGSKEALKNELEKRAQQKLNQKEFVSFYKRYFTRLEERKKLDRKSWPVRALRPSSEKDGLGSQSGKVVLWAIGINSGNMILKLGAWLATGSHAMFSECIHSAADTINQVILAYGLKSSAKQADEDHPYGYRNMPYVSSLISGVGIFCVGAGLSVYHGIDGLISPHTMESLSLAIGILGISFMSESVTLLLAIRSIRESASFANMGFVEYVVSGHDPCVNVVLLEDTAAVLGVMIAAGSMGLSLHYGSHIPDALGSILIGGLLGGVAMFMITTNSNLLVGM